MGSEGKKNKTIAIVTYPRVALLDLVATKTVLDSLAMGTRYNSPMAVIPEKRFEEVPDPFALIVPGRRPSPSFCTRD
jgi:hypothetical protein